jgi:hypothetical protein
MSTMTISNVSAAFHAKVQTVYRPNLVSRIFESIAQSRCIKAEIETRRVMSMLERGHLPFEDALLPFRGE